MFMDLSSESISEANKEQFYVEMMKRLDLQRRNEQFCDVILEVGSGDDQARLKAHRIVLCAASPFFYNALNSDMKEKKEGVMRLEETSKAVMEKVLEYLYTGHVDISEHNAFDLLQIADFLIAPSLKEISSKFISQTLSSSNCIKTFYFAERCDCPELVQSARDFVFANFMDVTQSDDFLNLSVTEVENWILGDDIIVKGEEEVVQVIVKWVEKCETRKHSFLKLFCHVRLVYVSRSYVFNAILPHPLVKDSATCTELVLDVMKELSYGTEECYFAQPPRKCLKTHEDAIFACGLPKKQAMCYVPSEEKWYKMAGITKTLARKQPIGPVMSTCHGKVYLAGQNNAGKCTVERYDASGNSWAPVKSCAAVSTCFSPAVVSFQGVLYMVGGKEGNEGSGRVHKYNPDTNLWQEVAPMSIARCGICTVADKTSLYAIGGFSKGVALDVAETFDPVRNCWKRIASTLEKKAHACGAVVRDKLFLFGGFTCTAGGSLASHSNLIEMYDTAANMWSSIECVGAPQSALSAVSFKGKVFVICASIEEGKLQSFSLQAYDVNKNEWEYCSTISNGQKLLALAAVRIPTDILDNCEVVPQE